MLTLLTIALLLTMAVLPSSANDGLYHTSGSFLIPLQENNISVAKEVLTIKIGNDGYAYVDVQYEFLNKKKERNVTMAFEAEAPYNTGAALNRDGGHPAIADFTVNMNGATLPYTNGIVLRNADDEGKSTDFTTIDMAKWKGVGEVSDEKLPMEDAIYSVEGDSTSAFAYAYFFNAKFIKGKNTVHHTYRYKMSASIDTKFEVPYWLIPAARWAGGKIGDFTLRICADNVQGIAVTAEPFEGTPFTIGSKTENTYPFTSIYHEKLIYGTLSQNIAMEWHKKNYTPTHNMRIYSDDKFTVCPPWNITQKVVVDNNGTPYIYMGDTDNGYLVMGQDVGTLTKSEAHIEEYSAEKGNGFLIIKNGVNSNVNIREKPTLKSAVVAKVVNNTEEMPEVCPCLGMLTVPVGGSFEQWFKTKVGNKTGYVRDDLMQWTPVNTY